MSSPDMYERARELGRDAAANLGGAPTPSEVDDLLALIASTGYASECVELHPVPGFERTA